MNNYELQMLNIDQYTWKPVVELAPNCPRCDSSNTKFCYYNNYSLTQPRYFCKNCRRYWTKGGALRNVPVGGGCRKKRRSSKKLGMRSVNSAHHQIHDSFASDKCDHAPFNGKGSSVASDIDLSEIYAKYANGSGHDVSAETMENGGDCSLVDEIEQFFSFPLEDEVINCEFGTMPVMDSDLSAFNPCSSYFS